MSFRRVWARWFGIGLMANAVLVAIMWVVARYGGLGDMRYPWLVGVTLLVGTVWFATRKAIATTALHDAPDAIKVATVSTPVQRDRKGR